MNRPRLHRRDTRNAGIDPDTRDMVNAMLRCSYYTDDMIARHTGMPIGRIAAIRNRRGEPRPAFPTYKGMRHDKGESSDDWMRKARAGSERLALAIGRMGDR